VSNKGRLLALSTPRGKLGFFYERWSSDDPAWLRINAQASESPRIFVEALAEQRATLGARLYASEFDNEFLEETDQVFSEDSIEAIFNDSGHDAGLLAMDLEGIYTPSGSD
jgi:hypothetical protein